MITTAKEARDIQAKAFVNVGPQVAAFCAALEEKIRQWAAGGHDSTCTTVYGGNMVCGAIALDPVFAHLVLDKLKRNGFSAFYHRSGKLYVRWKPL